MAGDKGAEKKKDAGAAKRPIARYSSEDLEEELRARKARKSKAISSGSEMETDGARSKRGGSSDGGEREREPPKKKRTGGKSGGGKTGGGGGSAGESVVNARACNAEPGDNGGESDSSTASAKAAGDMIAIARGGGTGVERARKIRENLRRIWCKKFPGEQMAAGLVIHTMDAMIDLVTDAELRIARLEGELAGRKHAAATGSAAEAGSETGEKSISAPHEDAPVRPSFRDAVANLQEKVKPRPVVIVRQEEGQEPKTSQELKKKIVQEVKVREEGVQVKQIRLMKSSAVAVELKTRADAEKLAESQQWRTVGMKAAPEPRQHPQVIIYDVEEETMEELTRVAYELNEACSKGRTLEQFRDEFKPVALGPKNSARKDCKVRVEPTLYRALINAGKLNLTYSISRVRDYVPLRQCFKCGCYGHIAVHCNHARGVCYKCGSDAHESRACREVETCGMCRRIGRPAGHRMNGHECPIVWRMLRRVVERTDYGR